MMRLSRLLRDTRGSSAVEMALSLPMVMALMFGGFEAGNYLLTEHKVIKGVRDGARYAARQPFSTYDCSTSTITDPAIETDIKEVTRTGHADGTGPTRVNGWDDGDVSVLVSCSSAYATGIYRDLDAAPRVMVTTTVQYPSILGMLGFDTRGAVVRAQAQAAVTGV